MDDLISRQALIDAFDAIDWYHQNRCKDMVSGANPDEHQAWYKSDDVYKALENVPSAQPEIIRCKDCKKYDTHDHRCKHWNHGVVVMDWCSRVERKDNETD